MQAVVWLRSLGYECDTKLEEPLLRAQVVQTMLVEMKKQQALKATQEAQAAP